MLSLNRIPLKAAWSDHLDVGCAQTIVSDPLMRNSAILVFANKQDMVSRVPLLSHV